MKTANRRYEVTGMQTGRTLRRVLIGKVTPYWSCSEGLHLSKLAVLALRHRLGYPLAWLTLRYEPYWLRLLALWRRRRPDFPSDTPSSNPTRDPRS
jgi:hypothetical protein